jgi:signal transduction histidine kinase
MTQSLYVNSCWEAKTIGFFPALYKFCGQPEWILILKSTKEAYLEETVRTLRGFVADAAHQLITHLTSIRKNLELAEDERKPLQRKPKEDAKMQLGRMETMVNDLLELSRLESNGFSISKENSTWSR